MVDTVNHTGLSLSQLDGVATSSRETYENQKAKPLQRSRWKVGWVSRNKSRLRSRQNFFLDIPPQKQTQDCAATVIWRPSLAAFF